MPPLASEPTPPPASPSATSLWWRLVAGTAALILALGIGGWVVADQRGRAVYRQHLAGLEAAGRTRDPAKLFTPAVEGTFWGDPGVRELMEEGGASPLAEFQEILESDAHYVHEARTQSSRPNQLHSLATPLAFEEWFPALGLDPHDAAARVGEALAKLDWKGLDHLSASLSLSPSSPWLDEVPSDPWSGGSLIYRLEEEGRPVIYSVGRNGVDDGGTPGKGRDAGDLVWR